MNTGWTRTGRIAVVLVAGLLPAGAFAQTAFTWQQLMQKFEATNPTMKANRLNIDESKAAEITAYLRPNPDLSVSADGFQVHSNSGIYRPLSGIVTVTGVSYLHEREHKRELRRDQAKESTAIAETTFLDQERS